MTGDPQWSAIALAKSIRSSGRAFSIKPMNCMDFDENSCVDALTVVQTSNTIAGSILVM
jgi:hypothetical protein